MAEWVIGYPDGLDTAATEQDGMKLYNPAFASSASLAPSPPKKSYFSVSSVTFNSTTGNTEIVGSGVSWGVDDFANGTVVIRSWESGGVGIGWRVASNDATTLYVSGDVSGQIAVGDWMEVQNGASSVKFSTDLAQYNPIRKELKRGFQDKDFAMPYFDAGIVVPMGYSRDELSFIVHIRPTGTMTAQQVLDQLSTQLLKRLDYTGMNAFVSRNNVAPQIIDMGGEQVVAYIKAIQPVYDPKSLGKVIELKVQAFIVHNR